MTPSRTSLAAVSLLFVLPTLGSAQTLVRDIYEGIEDADPSSSPDVIGRVGSVAYFKAYDELHGAELWRSDGTEAGTYLVADILSGTAGSFPHSMVELPDGTLLFVANHSELWRTDGTAAGTALVHPSAADVGALAVYGDLLYFMKYESPADRADLWRTDGTAAGTELFHELGTGNGGGLEVSGGLLYASADTGNGSEGGLWITDGTLAGTEVRLFDGGRPHRLTDWDGELYFSGFELATGRELWRSDGTVAGTELVVDLAPGENPSLPDDLVPFAGKLFFTLITSSFEDCLMATDGTAEGTTTIIALDPAGASSLTVAGSLLYFSGDHALYGREPFATDGTPAGTFLLRDIAPGNTSSSPLYFTEFDGRVYFSADDDSVVGRELWSTDGTTAGTTLFGDLLPVGSPTTDSTSPHDLVAVNGYLLFTGYTENHGQELLRTDGTPGVATILDLNTPDPASSAPAELERVGDVVYFAADDPLLGRELWRSDGTEAGTFLLADIRPGRDGSDPEQIVPFGDGFVFVADDGVHGAELWISDGTTAGTQLLLDIRPGAVGSDILELLPYGDTLLFGANDGVTGSEIWRSDGTVAGTYLVADVRDNKWFEDKPRELTPFAGRVFYTHRTDATGRELFVTDGTTEGTGIFADIVPGTSNSLPEELVVSRGHLYFRAKFDELWRTDGVSGAEQVAVLFTHGPRELRDLDGTLVFHGGTGVPSETALWRSDGTSAGTEIVSVLEATSGASTGVTSLFEVAGDRLFTLVYDLAVTDLWVSDGTSAGTAPVARLEPALDPLADAFAVPAGSGTNLIFTATDQGLGAEAWASDGTSSGTYPLTDLTPRGGDSTPADFTRLGNTILFAAYDEVYGRELFSLPLADTGGYVAEPFGEGCPGTGGLVPRVGSDGAAALGGQLDVTVADALPGTSALLLVTIDTPLAIDVGFGCTVYLGTPALTEVTATDVEGAGSVPLPIPANPGLAGLVATAQYLVVDPGGAFAGAASLSDALEIVIGVD